MSYSQEPNDVLLQRIWHYLSLQMDLQSADVIIAGGGRDLHVAKETARLYHEGWAPLIVVSGGFHRAMGRHEVEAYTAELIVAHVPEAAIWPEPHSRNLGDNVMLSYQLLEERSVIPQAVILVHTPIASRRFYATALKQWHIPQPTFISRHEEVDFTAYCQRPGMEDTIPRMLGYFERMHSHVHRGFQAPQDIPLEVQQAYDTLVTQRGYEIRGLHD
ncbi:MAG TPA: YdcF family protein [Candidatus Saccharimonadales bacterium]|nr:YdcF family protein [Candidatus Saccharimonadales bacterium]